MINSTIELLKSHRSIRQYTDEPIPQETVDELILAGQGAATSNFFQGTTVIQVNDEAVRAEISELAQNQAFIKSAPVFFIFCADVRRSTNCCEMHGDEVPKSKGSTEQFIIATVDVALMAQNVAVAAESMGLGICYIGAIRNNPAPVSELLKLPEDVYPVFGMCVGHPAQDPEIKPRLPLSVVLKQDVYSDDGDWVTITGYDEHVREYYRTRTTNNKTEGWSEQMSGLLAQERRPHMKSFLADRGFVMR